MATTHVFTRHAYPRYEIRGAACGALPCANVQHVGETLEALGGERLTDAQLYTMVRRDAGSDPCWAERMLPDGISVHKLTAAERWRTFFKYWNSMSVCSFWLPAFTRVPRR